MLSTVIFWLVVIALLIPIALFTSGLVTIVLTSFIGGVGVYITIPTLLRIEKIKFVKFDEKEVFASFKFFFIGGVVTATCEMLPWLGIATSGVGFVMLNIISMLVSFLCAWFMAGAILSMYDI